MGDLLIQQNGVRINPLQPDSSVEMLFSSSALSTALTPRMVSLVTSGPSSSSSSGDEDSALSGPPTATSAARTTARTLGKRRERGMGAPTSASHGPPYGEAGHGITAIAEVREAGGACHVERGMREAGGACHVERGMRE